MTIKYYKYDPPPMPTIKALGKVISRNESLLDSYRMNILAARVKAAAILSGCPEGIDVIMDVLLRFYTNYRFFPNHIKELRENRRDIHIGVMRLMKLGMVSIEDESKFFNRGSPSRRKRIPNKDKNVLGKSHQ